MLMGQAPLDSHTHTHTCCCFLFDVVSETYPTLFTPAGWAFSIWGVIFLLEGAFSLYQLTPAVRGTALVQKGIGCVVMSCHVHMRVCVVGQQEEGGTS
jgi:hypothetical protein